MSDEIKSNRISKNDESKKSSRGLPTTGTNTPMPQVKPPRSNDSSKKS